MFSRPGRRRPWHFLRRRALIGQDQPTIAPTTGQRRARCIRTKNSLAMFFASDDKITEWTEKFANEITFGTPEKKIHIPIEDRRKGLLACLIATWNVCRDDFAAARQSKLPMTPAATAPSASATPATSSDEKIPKTWPKGIYQQFITDYKVSTGNTKTFPEKILLGAEQVVVRMWHEH
eukprot:symbB.v1.2.043914.t1/scaffold20548.1/size546/1